MPPLKVFCDIAPPKKYFVIYCPAFKVFCDIAPPKKYFVILPRLKSILWIIAPPLKYFVILPRLKSISQTHHQQFFHQTWIEMPFTIDIFASKTLFDIILTAQ